MATGSVERALAGDRHAIEEIDNLIDRARLRRDGQAMDEALSPIAASAAAGSESACELLVYLVDSNNLCDAGIRRVFAERSRVEDARQDALLALVRGISGFNGSSRFTTWLFSISNNAAKQLLRSDDRRESRNDAANALATLQRSTTRVSSMIASRALLDSAIQSLPPEFREVVVMREVEDRSYQEIADALEVEIGTVKSRLRRGRQRVAAVLADSK